MQINEMQKTKIEALEEKVNSKDSFFRKERSTLMLEQEFNDKVAALERQIKELNVKNRTLENQVEDTKI